MDYRNGDTPNPNHCPASRLVKIKELDALKHLVRKYPDVAMDWLSTKQMVEYLAEHRGKVGGKVIKFASGTTLEYQYQIKVLDEITQSL
ncbi:MAG: hypothetical protein KAJ19_16145 [Gammaproteobacteria bacterium]|nr:hypothetical protein [Gammaproteobacteria bacterium]